VRIILVGANAHSLWGWLLALATVAMIVGCGDSDRPKIVPVTGCVTRNGQALAGADVMFLPEHGAPSSAKTDASGQFTLVLNDGRPGAVPGKHQVLISIPGPELPPPTGHEKLPVNVQPPMQFRQQADVKADGENNLMIEVGK